MPDKPGIASDVHILAAVEAAALHDVAELDVCPDLRTGTDAHVIVNVQSTE
jgi:hypothetical protein